MAVISTNDLEYQPKVNDSSFIDKKIKKKFRIRIFLYSLIIFSFVFLLLAYFLSLNYFRVISLSNISPIFNVLPISSYEVKDIVENNTNDDPNEIVTTGKNEFLVEGILQGFDNTTINIKTKSGKILHFEFYADSTVSSLNNSESITFTLDIFKKENIGKKLIIDFTKKDNINIINNLQI